MSHSRFAPWIAAFAMSFVPAALGSSSAEDPIAGTSIQTTPGEAIVTVSGSGSAPGTFTSGTGPSLDDDGTQVTANTSTGNRLTTLEFVTWTDRGRSAVEFKLHHNSIGSYDGEFGRGWSHSYDARITYTAGSTASLRMPDGQVVPYTHSGGTFAPPPGWHHQLVRHSDASWTLTFKDRTRYEFDSSGRLARTLDRAGNAVDVLRDSTGRLLTVRSADGRELVVQYGTSGRVSQITDPALRSWHFGVNGLGQLVSVTYPPLGGTSYTRSYTYDANHAILSETDLRGGVWQFAYSGGGRLSASVDPLGGITTYSYGSNSTTITLPGGQQTTHHYSNGLLSSIVDAAGFSESFVYDGARNVVQHTDQRGHTTVYTYDTRGNVLSSTDALGRTWSTTYNLDNDRLSETDPLGATTTYAFDSTGNLLQSIDPLGRLVEDNQFDAWGQLVTSTDALGRTEVFGYDPSGNLISRTAAGGLTTTFTHDVLGRVLTETDPGGSTWTASYDNFGRQVATQNPDGSTLTWTYDPEGALLQATNELGAIECWEYDLAGRLTRHTNPLGQQQNYVHSSNGWLVQVIDARGHVRSMTRTARGELAGLTLADGTHESWTYTGTGEVASYTVGGQTIHYTHDAAGQLVGADYPISPDVTLEYDATGRTTRMTDASGVTEWQYDAAGQLVRLIQPSGTTEYGYDATGDVTWMLELGRGTTWYGYDAAGREAQVVNALGETTTFSYDARGLPWRTVYANGITEEWTYDARSRPVSIQMSASDASMLVERTLHYDVASRLTAQSIAGVTTYYAYDAVGQLVAEANPVFSAAYTYDANGNRLTRTVGGSVENYTYDAGDKLTKVTWPGGSRTYTYDAAGRLGAVTGTGGTTAITYDDEGRVVEIVAPGTAATYVYNGLDARVGSNGTAGDFSLHRDGASVTAPVLFDGKTSFTPAISEHSGGSTRYHHSGLKNVDVQSSDDQALTAARLYDAFGNPTVEVGTWQGPYGHAGAFGYWTEGGVGLQWLGHRVYDPSIGRFLTRDPVSDGRNWYGYGSGLHSPTQVVDPDGQTPKVLIVILVIKGAKHVYKVYKTGKKAKEAAKAANKSGKVRKDPGHKGGPRHYHNEGQRKNVHYTSEPAAKAAKRRGAEHWRNFDPSKPHQILHH